MKSFFINAFAAVVVLVLGYGVISMYSRGARLTREFEMLKAQMVSVEEENEMLEKDAEYYSHLENLEKEARARLNVKKPGERLIIITPPRGKNASESVSIDETKKVPSWWERIKKFLMRD